MNEHWFNFFVVILTQLVIFLIHARAEGRLREAPRILMLGVTIGIPFGFLFDLIVGKTIGFFSYSLGFASLFLIVNGALSYGFMQANVLLMDKRGLIHFYVWSVIVGALYELVNLRFPVWHWEFASSTVAIPFVIISGYFGLALLMALVWHLLGHRFSFITAFLPKHD